MKAPETLHEVNEALCKINEQIKPEAQKVAEARQNRANARRYYKLAYAKAIEEARQMPDKYTSDEARKSYAIIQTEKELEAQSATELVYSNALDERQRLEDYRDDLKEISYNLRAEVKRFG